MKWHTDLDEAIREATRTQRPILSLRLLGRLDEELSCANSRYFRTLLYPDRRVAARLRGFVLHWRSVRPVPILTIDFGDGRTLTRPITGNSAHYVLDSRGRPVDALPGLFSATVFAELLEDAARAAKLSPRELTAWHASRRDALTQPSAPLPPLPTSRFPNARAAGELAATKMMVERPLLDAVLERSVALDTWRNQYDLHRRIHERFAAGQAGSDVEALNDWVYRELFLMPPEDPWLGLKSDAYAALDE